MDVGELCTVFGLGAPTAPMAYVARGELGRVSRLATTTGAWAVKEVELFVPTADEADANVALQEAMLDAGVRLPRPRRTADGHGSWGPVRVYEWLDLHPLPGADPALDASVAASLALAHTHAPPGPGPGDPWYRSAPTGDEWGALLDRGAGRWWAAAVAALVVELRDLPAPAHEPARLCHLDVCPENVFLCLGRVTILDWENAGPAATVQDLGSTSWDLFRGDRGRTRAFVDAYRRHGGPIDRLDEATFAMARVVQANLVAFHGGRLLDVALEPEALQRAEHALRDILDRPLTGHLVADLVAGA